MADKPGGSQGLSWTLSDLTIPIFSASVHLAIRSYGSMPISMLVTGSCYSYGSNFEGCDDSPASQQTLLCFCRVSFGAIRLAELNGGERHRLVYPVQEALSSSDAPIAAILRRVV